MAVGVYGLGRFGSFWASFLAQRFDVVAYNRTQKPAPAGVRLVDMEELCESEVVFLCVAISSLPEVLRELGPRVRPGCLVADTCSVKTLPVAWMLETLPAGVGVLATHPMFGPDSARAGVSGLPLIVFPARVEERLFSFWKTVFSEFGLAVIEMSPEEHDREAAFTQGVAHFIGRVLKDLGLEPSPIATLGYRKLLEIMDQTCNDPWQLFLDLQQYNPHTLEMRRRLKESLDRIMNRLSS